MFRPVQYAPALSGNRLQQIPTSQTALAYQLQDTSSCNQKDQLELNIIGELYKASYTLPKFPGFTRILSKHSETRRATDGAK